MGAVLPMHLVEHRPVMAMVVARGAGDARVHRATAAPAATGLLTALAALSAGTRSSAEGRRERCFSNLQEQKQKI